MKDNENSGIYNNNHNINESPFSSQLKDFSENRNLFISNKEELSFADKLINNSYSNSNKSELFAKINKQLLSNEEVDEQYKNIQQAVEAISKNNNFRENAINNIRSVRENTKKNNIEKEKTQSAENISSKAFKDLLSLLLITNLSVIGYTIYTDYNKKQYQYYKSLLKENNNNDINRCYEDKDQVINKYSQFTDTDNKNRYISDINTTIRKKRTWFKFVLSCFNNKANAQKSSNNHGIILLKRKIRIIFCNLISASVCYFVIYEINKNNAEIKRVREEKEMTENNFDLDMFLKHIDDKNKIKRNL